MYLCINIYRQYIAPKVSPIVCGDSLQHVGESHRKGEAFPHEKSRPVCDDGSFSCFRYSICSFDLPVASGRALFIKNVISLACLAKKNLLWIESKYIKETWANVSIISIWFFFYREFFYQLSYFCHIPPSPTIVTQRCLHLVNNLDQNFKHVFHMFYRSILTEFPTETSSYAFMKEPPTLFFFLLGKSNRRVLRFESVSSHITKFSISLMSRVIWPNPRWWWWRMLARSSFLCWMVSLSTTKNPSLWFTSKCHMFHNLHTNQVSIVCFDSITHHFVLPLARGL